METGGKSVIPVAAPGPAANILETIIRWLIGGLFLFAGVLKARNPAQFAADISNYQLLPWEAAVAAALYIPWVEILSGVGLIANWNRPGALRILLLLTLIYFQALLSAWMRGLNIECGCFGKALASSNYLILFVRDILILAALLWLLFREWMHRTAEEAAQTNIKKT